MGKTGVMVCGHGSRDVSATHEFRHLVDHLETRMPEYPVEMGYLEFATPIIRTGLDALRARGVDDILAVPCMLFAAGHVKNDVPSVLNAYAAEHEGLRIRFGRDLGIDARLLQAARDRIRAALNKASGDIPLAETLLVVIGRGTSDSDANGNVAKVARMIWEGMDFPHAEIGFSGVCHPRTDVILDRAVRLGYRRIVVFPYFLFTGVLVRRIYDETDAAALRHPDVQFVKAGYLNDHALVVETFVDRIQGIMDGDVNMNCQLCKYREQIIGFEASLGVPQESHHHHVEGIGTDGDGDGHYRGHGHHHGHHDHGPGNHGHHHHGSADHHDHDHDAQTPIRVVAGRRR